MGLSYSTQSVHERSRMGYDFLVGEGMVPVPERDIASALSGGRRRSWQFE